MKLLLVVIDGASPRVFCPAVQTGRLATMQRLAARGVMHSASVSIFPSITPAATCTLVTGAYPSEHGIEGAAWLQNASGPIAYYGDDLWVIAREGLGAFLRDFLRALNGSRLKVPTLFERIEGTGLRAASLNYLIYRGLREHQVRLPGLVAMLPGAPVEEAVHGPSILALGTLVDSGLQQGRSHRQKGGPLHRFGMDDEGTGAVLCALVERGALPDFTVAYFADNDFRSHEAGPFAALSTLDRVDAILGAAFDRAGGVDAFLRETAVIVTSDHGHCEVLEDESRSVLRLDEMLRDEVRLGKLGEPWTEDDEAMVCPNMRAAQIYLRSSSAGLRDRIVPRLLEEPRVDQVMWRADGPPGRFVVASARGSLTFERTADGGALDAFGGGWRWTGDLEALDARLDGSRIAFGPYPNAFERIEGALASDQSGDIWVTARPGCEFEAPGGKAHPGGSSHGALHELDSLSPVIVCCAPKGLSLPESFRSVDIAPLCMNILGLPAHYAPGEPRGGRG
jgi:hypothetical protein